MKFLRLERLLVLGIAILFVISWPLAADEEGQIIARTDIVQDDGSVLALVLIENDEVEVEGKEVEQDLDPFVTIKNSLDRNISIDLDGVNHYEVSLGDKKEAKKTFPAGDYKIMISAPSLKFVPDKDKVTLEENCTYSLILKRVPAGIKYE